MTNGLSWAAGNRSASTGRSPTFDPLLVATLPAPAKQWLTCAIEPGTPLYDRAELTMHGEIDFRGWRRFTAREEITPDQGFVWSARTRFAGLRVSGFDAFEAGEGRQRWRIVGLPLMAASGPDVTRSAADRLAAECVLLPTALIDAEWRAEPEPDLASFVRQVGGRYARSRVTVHVTDGVLEDVTMTRWGRAARRPLRRARLPGAIRRLAPQRGRQHPAHHDRVVAAGRRPVGRLLLRRGRRHHVHARSEHMTAPSRRAMQRSVALGMTRRLIGVAVRNVRHDGAALRWALFEAAPHADAVQVIHAYAVPDEPLLSAAQAVARDVGYLAGWEVVAAAVEQGSRVRPDVAIIGSPVGGPTEEVLTEISSDLDLLVLGDDEPDTPQRRIAAHLQRSARCPVVCVPHGTETFSALPVTVVADDLGLSPATLEFAAEFAGRHGVTLQVARTWRSLHRGQPTPDAVALAEAQVELDAELLELRRAYPELPVVSRIELDGTWLERVREHSGLVVAGRLAAPRLGLVSPLPAPLCPVAFVPETLTRGPSPAGLREPLGQKS